MTVARSARQAEACKRSIGGRVVRCHRGCVRWTVMGYRSTNKTEYFAKYHIIWCPKYRRRVLRQEFPVLRRLPLLWGRSWFVSTVDVAPLDIVRQYIENQKTAA